MSHFDETSIPVVPYESEETSPVSDIYIFMSQFDGSCMIECLL